MHELQDHDFIASGPDPCSTAPADLCPRGLPARITQVVGETSTILAFAAAGGGVAVKPSSVQALQLEGGLPGD